jgi:glycosyltransferase involved in cell wall biosynthesis
MDRGGAELRTLELLRAMDRRNYTFSVAALSGKSGSLDSELIQLGGRVHYCALGRGFARRFRELLRVARLDVVHSHVHYASGYFLKLACDEGVPVRIAHFRTSDDGQRNTLMRKAKRLVLRRMVDRYATHILGVSEGALDQAWPDWKGDGRCGVVYNGLDTAPILRLPERHACRAALGLHRTALVVLHVGSWQPAKNIPKVISVFVSLAQQNPSAALVMAGRGDSQLRQHAIQALRQHGSEERVMFLGERPDVLSLMSAADVLLFPSRREGLPGVVLEACAVGLPVLATDLPCIEEIRRTFNRIRVLSVDRPDSEWAAEAAYLAAERRPALSEARGTFEASPFALSRAATAYTALLNAAFSSRRCENGSAANYASSASA